MNTMKRTSFFLMSLMFLMSGKNSASNHQPDDEEYICKKSPETQLIYDSVQVAQFDAALRAAEETYIDTMAFDTHAIAERALSDTALSIRFYAPEEPYIDDISFNTKVIATKYKNRQSRGKSDGMIRFMLIRKTR